jgi:hypothetical protein
VRPPQALLPTAPVANSPRQLKKLDGLIEKKIAEEAANPMPPLFDLASSMRPIPSSPKIEGIEP